MDKRNSNGQSGSWAKALFCAAAFVLTSLGALLPAEAICGAPFLIASYDIDTGYLTYIYNPTVTDNGYMGSSLTDSVTGAFWGVGVGDPALGPGADNGGWTALNWFYIYPTYPAAILTTWAASTSIDGCIDVMGPFGQRCQATLLQDVDTGTGAGLFVLLSTPDDNSSGDFFITNGGLPITLAPMNPPAIVGANRAPSAGLDLTVQGPSVDDLSAGLLLDQTVPECMGAGRGTDTTNGLVTGYELFYQLLPLGSEPPTDFSSDSWTDAGAGTIPLGSTASISIDCGSGDRTAYVAWGLVVDSGFVTSLLSSASTGIDCEAADGACCTDGPGVESDCILTNQTECEAEGGHFLGVGIECGPAINCTALLVTMAAMSAEEGPGGVRVRWTTALEIDTVGFRVLREGTSRLEKALEPVGPMVPALGSEVEGGSYEVLDASPAAARVVHYYIEDIDLFGRVTRHGPIVVERGGRQRPAGRAR